MNDDLIYGKNKTENVVCVEPENGKTKLFIEKNGSVITKTVDSKYWLACGKVKSDNVTKLEGDNELFNLYACDNRSTLYDTTNKLKDLGVDFYKRGDLKEMYMLKSGVTYYKGMDINDVSVLSFDIETTGFKHDDDSEVILITNTIRKAGRISRCMFDIKNYESQGDMIKDWCQWVVKEDPSIMIGHYIFGFDLPYLQFVADKCGVDLKLGRSGKKIKFSKYDSVFTKAGARADEYKDVHIYGRELVDTKFLAIKFDVGSKYDSYSLKPLMEQEGLEKQGRIKWNFESLPTWNYKNWSQNEWRLFREYCNDDGDDSLALFDLMAPQFFYYTRSIPRGFQKIIQTNTGSQFNGVMIRAYLQEGLSLPLATEKEDFEGGISFGNPGIFSHVYKIDVASLYPSIMLKDNIHDTKKDFKGYFPSIVRYFTQERLVNKVKANESGDRYYRDLEQSQKIFINSAYGFLGAPGLLFNYPMGAAMVTRDGRRILNQAIEWAESKNFEIVNADTDSISFTSGKKLPSLEPLLDQINHLSQEGIIWEDDGYYKKLMVVAAKNYVLMDDKGKLKIKGSSLRATNKEPALKSLINNTINLLITGKKDQIFSLYDSWVPREVDDISEWCSTKKITEAVLKPKATTQQRIYDSLKGKPIREGDKIKVFFDTKTSLCMLENYSGEVHLETLHKKCFKTMEIFGNLIDIGMLPNYGLKRNKELL